MSHLTTALVVAALLGSAVIGGVFFAFSSFVMGALTRLPTAEGVAAMQSINVVVLNRSFLGAFTGTAMVSVLLAGMAVKHWSLPNAPWVLSGALCYLTATFLVTGLGNVPLNNALAATTAGDSASVVIWEHYLDRWTRLNTFRCIGAVVAALCFIVALLVE
ncbi:MAG: DUF1772 domain-containing protein [Lysobacterales bacterium]